MTPAHHLNDDYRFKLRLFIEKHYMKFIFLLLSLIFILSSCNNPGGREKEFEHSKTDTIRVLAAYVDFGKKQVVSDAVYLICMDTMKFTQTDTITFKKTWTRDTLVFIPTIITDTTRKDSLGGFHKELRYFPTMREAVSFKFNLDSNISILNRFINNNPQFFKK